MKSIWQRLQTIERTMKPPESRACQACGHDDNQPVQYSVSFDEGRKKGEPIDRSKDKCPACGRTLVFRIEFDDRG